eukprot:PhF_6_TR9228/c0_g1_i1/m.14524
MTSWLLQKISGSTDEYNNIPSIPTPAEKKDVALGMSTVSSSISSTPANQRNITTTTNNTTNALKAPLTLQQRSYSDGMHDGSAGGGGEEFQRSQSYSYYNNNQSRVQEITDNNPAPVPVMNPSTRTASRGMMLSGGGSGGRAVFGIPPLPLGGTAAGGGGPATPSPRPLAPPPSQSPPTTTFTCPKILILGPQHSGKSSFINTYRRAVTGHDAWAQAPIGRSVTRGTTVLEPYLPTTRSNGVQFMLLDTAGKPLHSMDVDNDDSADMKLFGNLLQGMAWKSPLLTSSSTEEGSSAEDLLVPENAADHVILVLNAQDVVIDHGVLWSLWSRYECTLEKVAFLGPLCAWFEKRLQYPPYVVVTHMDSVGGHSRQDLIRKELGNIVHRNRIFCVTNPSDIEKGVDAHTTAALRKLHESVLADIKAKQLLAPKSTVAK